MRAVVVEALLVAEELLPGDVAGMGVVTHDRPVGRGHAAGPALDPRRLVGQRPRAGLGAAVDVGAGVAGVVQDVQDAAVPQRLPEQFAVAGLAPEAIGEEQVVLGEVLDDRQGRARLLEQGEEQADRLLHLLVGIEDEPAGRVEDQADGRTHPQFALFGAGQLAAEQAVAEPVQFGLAHGAEDAQQQAVGVLGGVVDAVLVDDQGVGQGTDLQQAIPVAAGAGQARGFQAEDGPGLAQPDLGDQELEAVAVHRGGAGASLVLVDDGDGRLRPAQVLGPLHEVVLPGGAGGVLADLQQGGLADVDEGGAVKMVGTNLGTAAWNGHDGSPG